MSGTGKYEISATTPIGSGLTTSLAAQGLRREVERKYQEKVAAKAKEKENAKRKAQAPPSTQTETVSKAQSVVTTAQEATKQQEQASTSLVSSTATQTQKDPESSVVVATEETKENEETGEEGSGREKEPIKKGKKVNEIKKNVTNIDVDTPIKRKEINIYNKSFLVETKVDDPLTEEQDLLYNHLYLPEFEGEEDEAWRKQVLQEVIDSCTGDFGITVNPKCNTLRSYLEKLALKVFETDLPIRWWKDVEIEKKKEEYIYPNEDEENEEDEDEDEATDYEIILTIALSDLRSLLLSLK